MNRLFTIRLLDAVAAEQYRIARILARLPRYWRAGREQARLKRMQKYLLKRLERP